jgi:hypothetical protein
MREGHAAVPVEQLLRDGGTAAEVAPHLTADLIRRLDDLHAHAFLARLEKSDQTRLSVVYIRDLLGIEDDDDIFFSDTPTATPERPPAEIARSLKGRRASSWWPTFAAQLAFRVYVQGLPATQAELEDEMLQHLVNRGFREPGRTTIQPAIAELYALVRNSD